ncbi:putative FAD-linked oxidase [Fimbriimonas ginsengisoli Gsoil 348]|uniref:Putative FAD-linked oxidase n=2 Tax=Fimbriimonas ginsengisoli TaxID=1005039 RepID=A0A068NX98_FIMGI|nr:putative FAD-linked oxidase [Fimbriimonas ginsengisoli Gsoil 348]
MRSAADGYLFRPTSVDEIRAILLLAKETGRQITLRGAGRSYGDANIGSETLVVDIGRMRRILSWDPSTGHIDCEGGVTIEGLWRHTIEDGYWPPVVSGTMYPTLAGALAMNIHGKNNFRVGTLGEQVVDMDVLFPTGELRTLTPADDLFYCVISGAGLLGVIVRVKLKMKRIHSGDLRVLATAPRNWDEQFAEFERHEPNADYMVSWVDCFGRGTESGRGQFHAAWYMDDGHEFSSSFRPEHQDLPDTIMGLVPKSVVWRFLKILNNRWGMRFINWGKDFASKTIGNNKVHPQSLVGFSFLLDYVPNWRNAYLPGGFIQYQTFVPKEHAKEVFARQVAMQQEAGLESFLGVLKRHRPDKFLFSHAVDGYSLALDFKVTRENWSRLENLCHRMNDVVLAAGGRFYFAKDSTLRPSDVDAYLGGDTLSRYRRLKSELDPDALLTHNLAKRLGL